MILTLSVRLVLNPIKYVRSAFMDPSFDHLMISKSRFFFIRLMIFRQFYPLLCQSIYIFSALQIQDAFLPKHAYSETIFMLYLALMMLHNSIDRSICLIIKSNVDISLYVQEFVLSPRGSKLLTCRWLPLKLKTKALVFLCHGNFSRCDLFWLWKIDQLMLLCGNFLSM